jgi:FkbM family methyltransferase
MTGATGNLYCGLHEYGDMGFLLHFLRSEDFFVDVGANIGSFSILASGVVGARSVALEPVPSTFSALRLNIAINGLVGMIDPFCAAAGPHQCRARFSIDRGPQNGLVADTYCGDSAEVMVMSLDTVIEKGTCPALLKVDVEGSEQGVLEGASKSLLQPTLKAVLLEGDSEVIAGMMSRAGFQRARYFPSTRRLEILSLAPIRHVEGTQNNLWIRDAELIQKQCSSARRFTVYGQSF